MTSNPNSRVANYTIQGFMYQFNKTLLAILDSTDDAKVTVEGLIEDIDIEEPQKTTAIQCKYHESQTDFSLSSIYKPLLQMMRHFHRNQSANVHYHLFVYFPNSVKPQIGSPEIEDILNTKNNDLQTYVTELKDKIDVTKFHSRFSIEVGPSLDNLEKQISEKLEASGFLAEDIPLIIYPNAIHHIAQLSTKRDATDRVTSKSTLLEWLHTIKKTTISRWTLALKSYDRILKARQKQLRPNLSKNARRRSFLISETAAKDFKDGIVLFISEYIDKYHYKIVHTETPLFCLDCDAITFDDIRERINQKDISFNDGYIGPRFDAKKFARNPVVSNKRNQPPERSFLIRLARYETDPHMLKSLKCDDFFILSTEDYPQLDLQDVNEERLLTGTLQQAKFLLGVSNVYE
jgi:hypothetical protein